MKFDIEKMIVAANDGEPAINIADYIAALRSCRDEPAPSTPIPHLEDTESFLPIPPCGIAGVELDRDSPSSIGNTGVSVSVPKLVALGDAANLRPDDAQDENTSGQASSMDSAGGWKVAPKAIVAATDSSVSDAIENLRNQLASSNPEPVYVNPDGTILNPGTPGIESSIANGDRFMSVPGAIVSAQWYELHPDLQLAEIAAMHIIQPGAQHSFLPNGKMCWPLSIHPVNVRGERRDWTFLAVYDSDHPQQRWGGSVKFYPVKPSYEDMCKLVKRSSVTPKTIPHLLRDDTRQIYMCTQDRARIDDGQKKGERVTTAAAGLRFAMRWVNIFELGIIDQKTWTMFQGEGEI